MYRYRLFPILIKVLPATIHVPPFISSFLLQVNAKMSLKRNANISHLTTDTANIGCRT